jgi:CheY-like chemotaxis protein
MFVETNERVKVHGVADFVQEDRARPEMELRRYVILVVEDDPDARELMQAVLEQRGATVHTAESVAIAMELFESVKPDVVVSDIAMPEEDGFALVRQIRALPPERGGNKPIIALSAYAASSDRTRALTAGFSRYLHKPVDFEELVLTIQSVAEPSV